MKKRIALLPINQKTEVLNLQHEIKSPLDQINFNTNRTMIKDKNRRVKIVDLLDDHVRSA